MSQDKKIKPSLPSGTRDFLPSEVAKRNYIFDVIRKVFHKYGFQQIETPAIEKINTLTGKYGDEGDKLLFKILNSGNPFMELNENDKTLLSNMVISSIKEKYSVNKDEFIHKDELKATFDSEYNRVLNLLTEKGLRYDLTVPLARYVVQHQNDLVFPFRRYHIAPVWRADRPQKGRYREFYQCDADVIGSNSLINEVELTKIYLEVFKELNINVTIKINSRKIISGIGKWFEQQIDLNVDEMNPLQRATYETNLGNMAINTIMILSGSLDKIDKIGYEGVKEELKMKFPSVVVDMLDAYQMNGANNAKLNQLRTQLRDIPEAIQGISEIEYILNQLKDVENRPRVSFNSFLARGLNYYTGIIWEVVADDIPIGSIGGGGRYENLTEMFGGRNMSGVGISFGLERIYDIMQELKLFPENIAQSTKLLFAHFNEKNQDYAFNLLQQCRVAGISAEIYPDVTKIEKQFKYANAKGIPYVAVIGDNEMKDEKVNLKNMSSGTQQIMSIQETINLLL